MTSSITGTLGCYSEDSSEARWLVHLLMPLSADTRASFDNLLNVRRKATLRICSSKQIRSGAVTCHLGTVLTDGDVSFTSVCLSALSLSCSSDPSSCSETGAGILFYKSLLLTDATSVLPPFLHEVRSFGPGGRFTIRQQVRRSRSGSQTSAGDICPSYPVELGPRTALCPS